MKSTAKTSTAIPPPRAKQMFQHGHRNKSPTGVGTLGANRSKNVGTYSTNSNKKAK